MIPSGRCCCLVAGVVAIARWVGWVNVSWGGVAWVSLVLNGWRFVCARVVLARWFGVLCLGCRILLVVWVVVVVDAREVVCFEVCPVGFGSCSFLG